MKYRILLCLFLLIAVFPSPARADAGQSICVVRFTNTSGDAESEWIGYFIADAVEKNLKVLPRLNVTYQENAMKSADASREGAMGPFLCETAKALGAANVVGGDYHKNGEDIAVNAYLFDVAGGNQIGGASFTSSLADLYARLNDLSVSLAGAMGITYSDDQYARLQLIPTSSEEAMALYGKALMGGPTSLERSEYLMQALSLDPSYTDALSMMGIYYYRIEKYAKAEESFERLAHVQPDYPNAFYNLALVLKARAHYTKAIETYRKAIEKEPDDVDAWNNMGVIYYLMGMYDEAKGAFEQAVHTRPDNVLAQANLERLNAAASRAKPSQPPIGSLKEYIEVGAAFYASGDYEKAVEYFEKALQIQPGNFKANNNLALTCMKLGKTDAAKQYFKRALQADPSALDVQENLAKLEGKPIPSQKAGEAPASVRPDTSAALSAAGRVYLARKDYAEAEKAFTQALVQAPNDVAALEGLGTAYLGIGDYENARVQFEKVLSLDPNNGEAQKRLQDIKFIFATNNGESALELPVSPEVEARGHFVRGNDFYQAGKYEDAVGEYLRALDLTPTNVEILNNLGTTYYTMGRYEDAKSVLKKAVALDPENKIVAKNLESLGLVDASRKKPDMNLFEVEEKQASAKPLPAEGTGGGLGTVDAEKAAPKTPPALIKAGTSGKETAAAPPPAQDTGVKVVRNSGPAEPTKARKEAHVAAPAAQAAEPSEQASQSHFNQGIFKESEGDLEGALEHYREAVRLEPNNAVANYNLGNIYFRLGAFESAIESYRAALKADAGFSKSYNNIGVAYYKLGNIEEAKKAWQQALQIDPSLESARENLNKYGGVN